LVLEYLTGSGGEGREFLKDLLEAGAEGMVEALEAAAGEADGECERCITILMMRKALISGSLRHFFHVHILMYTIRKPGPGEAACQHFICILTGNLYSIRGPVV
jgi:hypothetical protein